MRECAIERYPMENAGKIADQKHMRRPTACEHFDAAKGVRNEQLQQLGSPPLLEQEFVGARLYTGPMYVKYNAILRREYELDTSTRGGEDDQSVRRERSNTGDDGPMTRRFQALCKGNRYVTTLHSINSAVVKLGKLTKVRTVYRGLQGMQLPDAMIRPNEHNVRCGVEYSFMSTSTDRDVALQYATTLQGHDGGACSRLLFEVRMGMVDRGADFGWLSQYPHEQEFLFAPLTGISVQDELQVQEVQGEPVLIVRVNHHVNPHTLTLEKVLAQTPSPYGRDVILSPPAHRRWCPRCATRTCS